MVHASTHALSTRHVPLVQNVMEKHIDPTADAQQELLEIHSLNVKPPNVKSTTTAMMIAFVTEALVLTHVQTIHVRAMQSASLGITLHRASVQLLYLLEIQLSSARELQ